jgi:hypothetical protein
LPHRPASFVHHRDGDLGGIGESTGLASALSARGDALSLGGVISRRNGSTSLLAAPQHWPWHGNADRGRQALGLAGTDPTNFLERRFRTTSRRISDQFLDAYDARTRGGVVSCSGMLRSCELHGGSFIDPCGLGTLIPEEETESPEEVRSQRRRSLPNVDE